MFQNCKTSKKRQVLRKGIKYILAYWKNQIKDHREDLMTQDPKEDPIN